MFIVFKNATKENFKEIRDKLIDIFNKDSIYKLDYDESCNIGITIKNYNNWKVGQILNCVKEENLSGNEFSKLNYYIDYVETDNLIETINILKSSIDFGLI